MLNSPKFKDNCNRKLDISTAPTKAYSQALNQTKIDRQRVRSRESGMQVDSQTAMVDGVWSCDGVGGRKKRTDQDRIY